MNYIELINKFWIAFERNYFSCTETALYFYLLKTCNICGWPDSFKRDNAKIKADLAISYPTLSNARNKLKQSGLIDFKSQAGSACTSYTLKPILKEHVQVGEQSGEKVGGQAGKNTSYRENKLKFNALDDVQQNPAEGSKTPENASGLPSHVQTVIDYFNQKCTSLKPAKILTERRKTSVKNLIRQYGLPSVCRTIDKTAQSAFLTGQNLKQWKADFDWMVTPENFIKIMEDKYENKHPASQNHAAQANQRLELPGQYEEF